MRKSEDFEGSLKYRGVIPQDFSSGFSDEIVKTSDLERLLPGRFLNDNH